jgi:uncharacterized protein
MDPRITIDLSEVAQGLQLPLRQVQATLELLDGGNTVPFITRYRKDQTGGLDEEQIREIDRRATQLRLLVERKQTVLRSIESQGKLTPELAEKIQAAGSTRELEDLYLPFKPKKQTLATVARERGLEPLAEEILRADPAANDLDQRAADFINEDHLVKTAAEALLGAGHIIAEWFSERAELRQRLREIIERTGQLTSARIETAPSAAETAKRPAPAEQPGAAEPAPESEIATSPAGDASATSAEPQAVPEPADREIAPDKDTALESVAAAGEIVVAAPAAQPAASARQVKAAASKRDRKMEREAEKKKQQERLALQFRDYFAYREAVGRVPPHRILAINRAERARIVRVRIEADEEACRQTADEVLVPPDHPHAEFLRGCARDALNRLLLPSLERELRRELTDFAEEHAVGVFARNLRTLLLQPPVPNRRILAVDPGFKSGCKIAALDEFGNLLGNDVVHIIGKQEQRAAAKAKLIDMIQKHQLSVIAIGNGTACRQTEELVAEILSHELQGQDVSFVIVNEAGASVYSASPLGREEFPEYDATLRGTISIGRRLQDPLSELVKIEPASIGVGMYQHDVKAKHLRDTLDHVVESCVNFVGVELNSASPALLRYVSGLNQLTARRIYDYRCEQGPFNTREQLKQVPGFGEATFTQAAGFLKIGGAENPLDGTWIHPESYDVARRILEKLGFTVASLADKQAVAELATKIGEIDRQQLAIELNVGQLTLDDILANLTRPGRDPREDLPKPVFKHGILKLEDLQPGMELSGTVLNVVDFGAFVDIGLSDRGLVHISQIAGKYIASPHEVLSVGDIVHVWVLGIDKDRRRVSLTMIQPGSRKERERPPRREPQARPRAERSEQGSAERQGARPPRDNKRYDKRRPAKPERQRKRRPEPVVKLTTEMKEGKEPVYSFAALKQLLRLRAEEDQTEKPADESPPN